MNARNDEREIEDDGFITIDMHECEECDGEGCPVCHDEGIVDKGDGLPWACPECAGAA